MRNTRRQKSSKLKEIFITYIKNNYKIYIIVTLIFLIGLICGVVFVNKATRRTNR
ncbi:MAG: hypothetical protein HFJ53_00220 [Clostridia bacterium]|nr:hypothetical protein [Clostridia bacterium]